MKLHYSKFPDCPITQEVLQRENIGAVISAWAGRIYGKDPAQLSKGDFDYTDRLVATAQSLDLSIHFHPVIARYSRYGIDPGKLFFAHIVLAKSIVHQYAETARRWTLATELTCAPSPIWNEVIRFYAWVSKQYPDIELWIGDYGIYDPHRRALILKRLAELKRAVPSLYGFVGQDYVDLNTSKDKIVRFLKANALGSMPLLKFRYLVDFIDRLGLQFALEHSTFSNSPDDWPHQQSIYNCLSKLCDRTESEFWLWDCCDASSAYFHDTNRVVYSGVWDANGFKK